jgi:hypothetical protein
VQLSAKEYELLVALAEDPERVFKKEELLRNVWGFRSLGRTRLATFLPDLEPQRRAIRELASLDARRPLQLRADYPQDLDAPAVLGARGVALDPVALPGVIECGVEAGPHRRAAGQVPVITEPDKAG